MRVETVALQQLHQPAPAEGGLERHRRPRGQIADQLQDRLHPIDDVPVQLHLPVLSNHRHLRPLAVHIDSDVDRHHRASFPKLVFHPERPATGLSREGGPALIGADECVAGPPGPPDRERMAADG